MGIWLYPKQQGFMSCNISVEAEDDLVSLVDRLAHLYRSQVLQNHPVIGNVVRAMAAAGPRVRFYPPTEGAIPDAVLEQVRKEMGIGYWNARFAFYGTLEFKLDVETTPICLQRRSLTRI